MDESAIQQVLTQGKRKEYWACQAGLTEVVVDDHGCPTVDKFCKTQAGDIATGIVTGAAFTLTITLGNFIEALVRGLVIQAFDEAAGNADILHTVTITSIVIMGTEQLGNATVGAERYRADATGAVEGTGQAYRGRLGTTGGAMIILGVNNSAVTITVIATIDVNAVRG